MQYIIMRKRIWSMGVRTDYMTAYDGIIEPGTVAWGKLSILKDRDISPRIYKTKRAVEREVKIFEKVMGNTYYFKVERLA